MDRLSELEVFIAVLDAGSLSGAARKLGRSGPAITRIVAGLEDRLGVRLLERTTRRLSVTEDGRRLEASARDLLAGYAELSRPAQQRNAYSGLLRVTAPVVFGRLFVAPLVAEFLADHPRIDVELTLDDQNRDLVGEGFDVAIRIGDMAASELMVRKVGKVRRYLCASPAYLERAGMPRDPSDLLAHALIQTVSVPAPAEWRLDDNGRPRVVRFTPRARVNHVETALTLALEGVGIVRALSYQVASHVDLGQLVRLLPDYEPPARDVHIVHLGRRHMSNRTKVFVRHLGERLAAHHHLKSRNY